MLTDDHALVNLHRTWVSVENLTIPSLHVFSLDPVVDKFLQYCIFFLYLGEGLFASQLFGVVDILLQLYSQLAGDFANVFKFSLPLLEKPWHISCSLCLVDQVTVLKA